MDRCNSAWTVTGSKMFFPMGTLKVIIFHANWGGVVKQGRTLTILVTTMLVPRVPFCQVAFAGKWFRCHLHVYTSYTLPQYSCSFQFDKRTGVRFGPRALIGAGAHLNSLSRKTRKCQAASNRRGCSTHHLRSSNVPSVNASPSAAVLTASHFHSNARKIGGARQTLA